MTAPFPQPSNKAELVLLLDQVRDLASKAVTPDEARMLTSQVAQFTRAYRIRHGIGIPTNPTDQALELDPSYVVRPHLSFLSQRLSDAVKDVERGYNRKIAVSMPPRSGKSTLLSLFSPLWILRRHPEWKIVAASHDRVLMSNWAARIRRIIEDKPDLGIALAKDGGAGSSWETYEGGGMYTTSIKGGLTGRGARVMVIDDPVRDFVDAHSPVLRQNLWDWWLSVVQTRLEQPYLVIVVMCMTGDTPVLRPDGTETPLADIRPGDEIATFTAEGKITTSIVSNWANQGPDSIFALSMASGRKVRANARHPFWVIDESGEGSWVRLESLRVGMRVRCAAEPTEALSAPARIVTSQPSPRACVCRTTTSSDGQQDYVHPRTTQNRNGLSASESGTDSASMITSACSMDRAGAVPSVEGSLMRSTSRSTGRMSSASIIAMTQELCEACSATTATSSLPEPTLLTPCDGPLSTWGVSTDEIVAIEPAGREDVFDIVVVGTHNFIASRLCASNTRWHEDDFVGRLFNDDYEGDPKTWERISLPAIAEPGDSLGRAEGAPLLSPIIEESEAEALDRWADVRRSVGTYIFSSMYQQRPAPARGAIFDAGWWRYWTFDPMRATEDGRVVLLDPDRLSVGRWVDSWDCTFKSTSLLTGDWTVGQRWVRESANRYLMSQQRGRWSFTQTIAAMERWSMTNDEDGSPYGSLVHDRLIEERANGAAIIDVLKERISGLKPVNPTVSKEARARAVTPEIESGNVFLPHPADPGNEWVADLLSELRNFPHDAHDDQVDTLTQALAFLRDSGRGQVTVPGRMAQGRPQWQVPRDLARTALTDLSRRRPGS